MAKREQGGAQRAGVVGRVARSLALFVMLTGLAACNADVHHGLDERAANDVVAVLAQHNIVADKARDSDGWRVVVPRAQRQSAISTLAALGLPRAVSDFEAMLGDSSGLVPSASDERARRTMALERHVGATLSALDGVRDAYVHLTLARESTRLGGGSELEAPARASVVVTHRADLQAPSDEVIRGVVIGAVEGLDAEQITVIRTAIAVPPPPDIVLVAVGPFVVSESSASALWGVFAGLSALVVMLALSAVWGALRPPREGT